MALGSSSAFQYSQKPGRRRVWDISVGKEIPAFGWERRYRPLTGSAVPCFAAQGYPPPGCSGIGVWVPVSLHAIEDFKDPSNPIIDTDYRFGGMLKFEHRFGGTATNADDVRLLKLRLYFGHRSTHLGDEFSLAAQRNATQDHFQRVNISYQYWEYGVSYERVHGIHVFKFRHGGAVLDPLTTSWSHGFYSFDPVETNNQAVTPSHNKFFEPHFGFEYLKDIRVGQAPCFKPFMSLDVRHRPIYHYAKPSANHPDGGQWSYNVVGGVRRARGLGDQKLPSLYVRLYYGANPWGQLQTQRNYVLFGVGLHFSV